MLQPKRLAISLVCLAAILSGSALCAQEQFFFSPRVLSFTATPQQILPGGSTRLAWSTANADRVTITGQDEGVTTGYTIVSPTETCTYTLVATRGRGCCSGGCSSCTARGGSATATVTVTVAPGPTPNPTPGPAPASTDSTLSVVGVGSEFALSQSLAEVSHSHAIAAFLGSQNGSWLVIDPAMLTVSHPPAMDAWVALAPAQKQPAVIAYSRTAGVVKILGVQTISATATETDVLTLLKGYLPQNKGFVTIKGQKRYLGLKPATAGLRFAIHGKPIQSMQAVLAPLNPGEYPYQVDLSTQFQVVPDQGQYGICYAEAPTSLFNAAVYRAFGPSNFYPFSPWYAAAATDGSNGGMAGDVIQLFGQTGTIPLSLMPRWGNLPAGYQGDAAQHTLLGVYGPPNDTSQNLGYIAAAIARGLPITCGISVGNGFNPDSQGFITYAAGAGNGVNHEITVCGGTFTSPNYPGRCFWKILNSWSSSWGVGGYAYLEDKFFTQDSDLWVIVNVSAAPDYSFDSPPAAK